MVTKRNTLKRMLAFTAAFMIIAGSISGCSFDFRRTDEQSEPASTQQADDTTTETESKASTVQTTSEASQTTTAPAADPIKSLNIDMVLTDLPLNWDLTDLFADEDAFNKDMDYVLEHLSAYEKYKGTLNSAENILKLTEDNELLKIDAIMARATMYTEFLTSIDSSDPWAKKASAKFDDVYAKLQMASSFIKPEIMSLSLEDRKKIFSDSSLKPYAYYFSKYIDPDIVTLSEESENVITLLGLAVDHAYDAYTVFDNVELPTPTITMPDGTEAELTDELYTQIVYSSEYDHALKKKANELRDAKRAAYQNTYAEMLAAEMQRNWALAQLYGYDTTLDYFCAQNDVEPEVYQNMIESVHSLIPYFQKYFAAKKKKISLSEMGIYDIETDVGNINYGKTDYETCVNFGRQAISVWGDEYLNTFDKIIKSGHIDVSPSDTKEGGAFEFLAGNEVTPYVLFNFDDTLLYTDTIVHEMGHAVYSQLSAENQNEYNNNPGIFTQEVASTANELMLFKQLKERASSDEEKLYWTDQVILLYYVSILRQCLYSEFEDYCYKTIEAGGALSAEEMNAKWYELMKEYYGDTFDIDESAGIDWARIPHFYYGYYVYQYATSLTYATAICNNVDKNKSAVSDYISFLKAGNSASPSELLKKAGVDPLDKKTYDSAQEYFSKLVDDFIKMSK